MSRLGSIFVLSVLFCFSIGQDLECGPHEVVNDCGSACVGEPTCQIQNPTQKPNTGCPDVCITRCECDTDNGWIRSCPNGPCIKIAACHDRRETEITEKCGSHKKWLCTNSCHPIPTCQNRNRKPPLESCGDSCKRKCVCDPDQGYIKNEDNGKCVKTDDCPQK